MLDEVKAVVESATNELLLRPDWDSNLSCVDLVNNILSQAVINEIFFLLRKKFNSNTAKVVFLDLTLIEALVKNCGPRVHTAINQESFIKELSKLAKKYVNKSGPDNAEVSSTVLDIIQAWGEAFLPYQSSFPNIPKLYQELRRERLPFKRDYDVNRVPIFTTSTTHDRRQPNIDEDELVAKALAASLRDDSPPIPTNRKINNSSSIFSNNNNNNSNVKPNNVKRTAQDELIDGIFTSVGILKEIILAATNVNEIQTNEIAVEVIEQISLSQIKLAQEIETAVMNGSEVFYSIHSCF